MNDKELRLALLKMLQAELDAMQYYQQASRFMQDEGARYHFNLLAQEELEHARSFHATYPGDDLPPFDELVAALPCKKSQQQLIDQQLMARLTEQQALQLAMKMEQAVVDELRQLLRQVLSPAARAVIEENISSTLGHLELIEEDYQRLYGAP